MAPRTLRGLKGKESDLNTTGTSPPFRGGRARPGHLKGDDLALRSGAELPRAWGGI